MLYKVLDLEQSNCIYFFFIYQVYSVNYFNIYCEHESLFLSLQALPLTVARSLLPPMHYNFPAYHLHWKKSLLVHSIFESTTFVGITQNKSITV
jgi:hypothetical protein